MASLSYRIYLCWNIGAQHLQLNVGELEMSCESPSNNALKDLAQQLKVDFEEIEARLEMVSVAEAVASCTVDVQCSTKKPSAA